MFGKSSFLLFVAIHLSSCQSRGTRLQSASDGSTETVGELHYFKVGTETEGDSLNDGRKSFYWVKCRLDGKENLIPSSTLNDDFFNSEFFSGNDPCEKFKEIPLTNSVSQEIYNGCNTSNEPISKTNEKAPPELMHTIFCVPNQGDLMKCSGDKTELAEGCFTRLKEILNESSAK